MYNSSGLCKEVESEKAGQPLRYPTNLQNMSEADREKALQDYYAKKSAEEAATEKERQRKQKENERKRKEQEQKHIESMMEPLGRSKYKSDPDYKADMDACLANTDKGGNAVKDCEASTWYKHVTLPGQNEALKDKL